MSQSGERTEPASPKKRRDARERGEVRKSQELNTSLLIVLSFAVLRAAWPYISSHSVSVMQRFLSPQYLSAGEISMANVGTYFMQAVVQMALILLPMLAAVMVGALLVNYMQVGFLFTTKTLTPKFSRINPMQGFKRVFSSRSVMELLKAVGKLAVIVAMCMGSLTSFAAVLPSLITAAPVSAMERTMAFALDLGLRIGVAMLIVGAADFAYQWWKFEKDLRMTKQEVKDEWKLTEGNPEIKSRIKQKQRQMSAARMMQMVPQADVVVTNPTHYAVALRYDEKLDKAPVVLAKGADFVAQRIRQAAAQHGIELVENRELARTLYSLCEVGEEVPEDLYQAVAEVLAYIYRLRPKGARPARGAV